MKYLNGEEVDAEYERSIGTIIGFLCHAEDIIGIDELEEYASGIIRSAESGGVV